MPEPDPSLRAERLRTLPPFLFNEIDRLRRERIAAGADVINLGVGDPDRPTPPWIIDEMDRAVRVPANHQYPDFHGTPAFREAAAEFLRRRFGVRADPARHILALMGSKDGIAHLPLALLNPGDAALVPDPAYPVYQMGTRLAGATPVPLLADAASSWVPRLDLVEHADAARARILWLNFPANPTAATVDSSFYEHAVEFAARHRLVVASDLAYSELYFDEPVPSLFQSADIDTVPAIEFHSCSKSFNMTGWRIAFAVGHPGVIGALRQVKDNYDSGPFNAVQAAGAVALRHFDHPDIAALRDLYRERRDIAVAGLRRIGCELASPGAGIFVWARVPADPRGQRDSMAFCARCLDAADTVLVPGAGFSPAGREWFRLSLTRETHRIREAMDRLVRMTASA